MNIVYFSSISMRIRLFPSLECIGPWSSPQKEKKIVARQLGLLILLILLKVLVKLLSDKTSREEFGSDISIKRRSTGVLFGHNKMDWLQNLMSPNGVGGY